MSDELKIEDIVVGDGKTCVKGALILTHYTGWLAGRWHPLRVLA